MPGEVWPEKHLIVLGKNYIINDLVTLWRIGEEELVCSLDEAILAGKHNEFYLLAKRTAQEEIVVKSDIVRCLVNKNLDEFKVLEETIKNVLSTLR